MLSNQAILERLNAAIESLVKPVHSDFFKTEDGRNLSEADFKAAYQEADRKYEEALKEYNEKGEALQYGIMHYEDKIKIEFAHELIGLGE